MPPERSEADAKLEAEYERLKSLENEDTNRRVSAIICAMGVSEFCAMGVVEALATEFDALAADAARWREIALALVDYGQESVYVAQTDHGFAVVREYDGYPLTELRPTPEAALLAWHAQRHTQQTKGRE